MNIFNIKESKKVKYKKAKRKSTGAGNQLGLFAGQVIRLGAENYFEEALKLDDMGDPCAKEFYLLAVESKQNLVESYCNLGVIESEHDKVKSFGYFAKALKENPAHCETHFNIGNLYFESGDLLLAKLHYEIAIEVEPGFPNSFFNLALVCIELEDFSNCVRYLSLYKDLVSKDEAEEAVKLLKQVNKIRVYREA